VRVYFDTNVLISALTTRGLSADLLRLVLAEHEFLTGAVNLVEFRRVLEKRFRVPAAVVTSTVRQFEQLEVIPKPDTRPSARVRDPDDAWVLASALEGDADLLVTGDRDLLVVRAKLPLRIVSPRQCWELLREA
jgi:putative PIN family toxin of toxin-antitoxin system